MIRLRFQRPVLAAALAVVVVGVAACGGSSSTTSADPHSKHGYGTVTVLAAASLTSAFGQLAAEFDRAYPGTHVALSFGGSSMLAEQIINGAPADVFASADQTNLAKVSSAGMIHGTPTPFAENRLEIVVARGNPKHISTLADLDRHGLVISLAGPAVPVGRYARQAFAEARVKVPAASQATDVSQVITQVELGQADAGVVYVTDVRAAGSKVSGVAIPSSSNVQARYPIGVVKGGADTAGGSAFVSFVTSPDGEAVLARYGFLRP
jgi:molybdate transport system substrate-binding protein